MLPHGGNFYYASRVKPSALRLEYLNFYVYLKKKNKKNKTCRKIYGKKNKPMDNGLVKNGNGVFGLPGKYLSFSRLWHVKIM